MVELLGFVVRVGVTMLDPLTLVVAALIGWGVSYTQKGEERWFLAALGAVLMTVASVVWIGAYVDGPYGQVGRSPTQERMASALIAHCLQIAIAMTLFRWLRHRIARGRPNAG
jgi:hypothetical protein